MYREKPIIVLITATSGAFAFCAGTLLVGAPRAYAGAGVGYFQDCEFLTVVVIAEDEITHSHPKLDMTLSSCSRCLVTRVP